MSDPLHFPRKGTGDSLSAICGRYDALDLGGLEDARRDRFTTDESAILNGDGCVYCRDALIEASRHDVVPQIWQHADVVDRDRRGELDIGLRPWPTWRGAVRSYTSWQDSGASLRSSSDPSRFEGQGGFTGTPNGDQGQRQAERLNRVGQAIEQAMPHGFVVTTYPETAALGPDECRRIIVAIVCGRDVDQRTGGQGRWTKQKIRVRLPITDDFNVPVEQRRSGHAILAAEVTERCGFVVTAGTIVAIEREGGRQIEAALSARGLISHADRALQEEATVVDKSNLLEGWKAVAEHLGWSEKRAMSARNWSPPIPVRTLGGRVEADAPALDEWRVRGAKVPEDAA